MSSSGQRSADFSLPKWLLASEEEKGGFTTRKLLTSKGNGCGLSKDDARAGHGSASHQSGRTMHTYHNAFYVLQYIL